VKLDIQSRIHEAPIDDFEMRDTDRCPPPDPSDDWPTEPIPSSGSVPVFTGEFG
jgi:hypothetical protein